MPALGGQGVITPRCNAIAGVCCTSQLPQLPERHQLDAAGDQLSAQGRAAVHTVCVICWAQQEQPACRPLTFDMVGYTSSPIPTSNPKLLAYQRNLLPIGQPRGAAQPGSPQTPQEPCTSSSSLLDGLPAMMLSAKDAFTDQDGTTLGQVDHVRKTASDSSPHVQKPCQDGVLCNMTGGASNPDRTWSWDQPGAQQGLIGICKHALPVVRHSPADTVPVHFRGQPRLGPFAQRMPCAFMPVPCGTPQRQVGS